MLLLSPTRYSSLVLGSLLLLPILNSFAASNVQIQATRPLLEMKNKGVVTIPFVVVNQSTQIQLFEENITLPEGWRLLSAPVPFSLSAGQRETRLIHVYAPSRVSPGRVSLQYSVVSRTDRSIQESTTVQINVKSIASAGLSIRKSPARIIAGNEFTTQLVLRNEGNHADTFVVIINDKEYGYITSIVPKKVFLKANEEVIIEIKGKIPARLKNSLNYLLKVKVKAKKSAIVLDKDVKIVLISRTPQGIGKYHSLSSQLTLRYLGNNTTQSTGADLQSSTAQLEFKGQGVLDDEAKHHINFELRAQQDKTTTNNNNFGLNEKYTFQYWNKNLKVNVGDFSFNSSQLLGGGFGRGLGVEYRTAHWWVKAAQLGSVDNISSEESTNLTIGYDFNNGIEFELLTKTQKKAGVTDTFNSVNGKYANRFIHLTTELTNNKEANAMLFDVGGEIGKISYDVRGRQADLGFNGSITDSRQLGVSARYPITERLAVTIGNNYQRNNLTNDQSREIKEHDDQYIRLGYDVWDSRAGRLSFEGFEINEKDLRSLLTIDTNEKGGKLEYQHQFDPWNAAIKYEKSTKNNKLISESTPIQRNELRLDYVPEDKNYHFGSFWENIQSDTNTKQTNYGISGAWDISKTTKLSGYWRKGLLDSEGSSTSNFYELKASHQLNNGFQLSLRANRNLSVQDTGNRATDTGWMIELGIPLEVPVRKRNNIGSLSGQVIHADTRQPIANAVVDMKGMYATSDSAGNFSFPDVFTGDYELDVDLSHLDDSNYTTASGDSLNAQVIANKETKLVLPMIPAASLRGVVTYATRDDNDTDTDTDIEKEKSVVSKGKSGLLVTLTMVESATTKNAKVYKRLTMSDGGFIFYGIPPGIWQIQITDPDHRLDREKIEEPIKALQLKANEKKALVFHIIAETSDMKKTGPSGGFTVKGN